MLAFSSPFDLNGLDFLKLYWGLGALAVVGGYLVRQYFSAENRGPANDDEPSPYEVACLAGPPARAVHAAIAQLCQDGFVSVDAKTGEVSFVAPGEVAGRPAIEQAVLRAVAGNSKVALKIVEAACAPALADLQTSLRAKGLLLRADNARLGWMIPSMVFSALQLFAIIRLIIGWWGGKPIAFLVISWLAVGFIGAMVLSRKLYRTKRGDRLLAALKVQYAMQQREQDAANASGAPGAPATAFSSMALPLAVGLVGYSVLAGTPADGMYQRMRATGSGDGSGTSSDSSSSSDSGGGDSGGGGGCGGCGGGGGD